MVEAGGALQVVAVNRPAAVAGLRPGATLADARAVMPAVLTVPAEAAEEGRALARLAQWCGRYSPWTAIDPAGGVIGGDGAVWLDATGCAHLFGGEAALLADLIARLGAAGLAARAAVAETPGAAWAVARYAPREETREEAGEEAGDGPGDGGSAWRVVAPDGTRAALAALPVAALRLTPSAVAGLEALGLRRVRDVLALPRAALAARFGGAVGERLDAALGRAPEPLSPLPPATPHFVRLAFAEPIGRIGDVAAAARHLLDDLCAGLERAGDGARRLELALHEPDGAVRRIRIGASRPSRDPDHLARLFAEHLDGVEAEFGIEAMTLAAPAAEALAPAQSDLENAGAPPSNADALVDRLSNRLGAGSVVRFAAHESHIPERAVRALPAVAPPAAAALPAAAWPGRARPLRLLVRPEPIEATAPVPDDPPVMFRWRRVLFRIARADGPERIESEWWREGGVADRDRLRDYYRVEDTEGRRFWLYREGLYRPAAAPAWFLHGIFG